MRLLPIILALSALPLTVVQAVPITTSKATAPKSIKSSARMITPLMTGWQFKLAEGDGATPPAGEWDTVNLPHSWNALGEYQTKRGAAAKAEQGVGWYKLNYDAPIAAQGKRFTLDFAAVGSIAQIWVNGQFVGEHKGAFGRFRLDVTKAWMPGRSNKIVVRADNSKPAKDSSTEFILPLAGDFFVHGGMYRDVSLITSDTVGIDLFDYGGPGVYASTSKITKDAADVAVLTRLANHEAKPRALTIETQIYAADGTLKATSVQKTKLSAGKGEVLSNLTLVNPRLWDGTGDPYLYNITVTVRDGRNIVDKVTQPLGVRTIGFDADKGFFLNGRRVKLHGVSRHQDFGGKGWALSADDIALDMALIKEMGANTVRHAHYQHADAWSDAADKEGMMVWAEVPYVTTPSFRGGEGDPQTWANAERQTRELIRQNYNHPSIMLWSVGNEIDAGQLFGATEQAASALPLLQNLNTLAKAEDATRPTTYADCCEGRNARGAGIEPLIGVTDVVGYNRYFGWYDGHASTVPTAFGAMLDKAHSDHPTTPISVSEYGGGGALSQHSDDATNGFVNFTGRPQTEEYQAYLHEQSWPVIRERDFVFASWVWNMFDFTSDLRKEGDSIDINTKGLVSFDRRTKKDAFYYYKAQWNPAPMIHLTGKRHVDRPYPAMEVKAYSNAATARLTFNGLDMGEVPCNDRVCVWRAVPMAAGANEAVVTGELDRVTVTDQATWMGPDTARDGLRIDVGNNAGGLMYGHRFGSDTFVTGGTAKTSVMGSFGAKNTGPQKSVVSSWPDLFNYWREGDAFDYAIPLPNGQWIVTIHTFEPDKNARDDKTFQVTAQGKLAVPPMSILKATGGPMTGLTGSFPVTVGDGLLRVSFRGSRGPVALAGIEIKRLAPHK
jgi:beta-galactosidase